MDYICSKISQRLHFLRRLRIHGVDKNIMLIFYRASIESLLRYGLTWFGNLSIKLKSQILNLIKRAGKIMGVLPPCSLLDIFEETALKLGRKIANDSTHFLFDQCEVMPSGRRYRVANCRLNRYKHSLIPLSIALLNRNKSM